MEQSENKCVCVYCGKGTSGDIAELLSLRLQSRKTKNKVLFFAQQSRTLRNLLGPAVSSRFFMTAQMHNDILYANRLMRSCICHLTSTLAGYVLQGTGVSAGHSTHWEQISVPLSLCMMFRP